MSTDSVVVGQEIAAKTYRVRRPDLIRYAGASGDFNSIHWSDRTALAVGLPGVIGHGMLTMARAVQFVVEWTDDPAAILDLAVDFSRPVEVPDDDDGAELTIAGKIAEVDGAARTATVALVASSGGVEVLKNARAIVRLPGAQVSSAT